MSTAFAAAIVVGLAFAALVTGYLRGLRVPALWLGLYVSGYLAFLGYGLWLASQKGAQPWQAVIYAGAWPLLLLAKLYGLVLTIL